MIHDIWAGLLEFRVYMIVVRLRQAAVLEPLTIDLREVVLKMHPPLRRLYIEQPIWVDGRWISGVC
jgi:hypothetical protein